VKLHLTTAENQHLITGYGTGENGCYVEINRQRHSASLIVLPEQLILDWPVASFADLTTASFEQILALKPEVVLLGTGEKHQFLHPKISASLAQNSISLECMTTAAACRTYNILMSEGRVVAAMLII
jgi:uncharacterized protein